MTTIKPNEVRIALAKRIRNQNLQAIIDAYREALLLGMVDPIVLMCDVRNSFARGVIGSVFGDDERNSAEAINAGEEGGTAAAIRVFIRAAPAELVRQSIDEPGCIGGLQSIPHMATAMVYCDWLPVIYQVRYEWGDD